jgi:hypothetical protein
MRSVRSSSRLGTASSASTIEARRTGLDGRTTPGDLRIEARREQRCERAGDPGVPDQRRRDVLLAEREVDLAQVARVRAQDLHFAHGEPGASTSRLKPSTSISPRNGGERAAHLVAVASSTVTPSGS